MSTSTAIRDVRRRHHVERVCDLGNRVVDELLKEIGAEHFCMTSIEIKLEQFARLDRDVVAALGAGQFPVTPIHAVNDDDVPPEVV